MPRSHERSWRWKPVIALFAALCCTHWIKRYPRPEVASSTHGHGRQARATTVAVTGALVQKRTRMRAVGVEVARWPIAGRSGPCLLPRLRLATRTAPLALTAGFFAAHSVAPDERHRVGVAARSRRRPGPVAPSADRLSRTLDTCAVSYASAAEWREACRSAGSDRLRTRSGRV